MANNETSDTAPMWAPPVGKAAPAALLGGLVGFAIIQAFDPIFQPESLPEMGLNPTGTQIKKFIAAQKNFYSSNYAVEFAILGACIGLAFVGITASVKRIPSALLAGVLGAIGAGATGYYAGLITGEELALSKDQSLVNTAMVSFMIWAAMAVAIALGGSLLYGAKACVNAVLGGLISAILVAVSVLLVFSIAFPGANLADHVPLTLVQRLVWAVVASATFGAAMAMVLKPAKPTSGTDAGDMELAKAEES